jgi:predicted nucleic acid-binding protein
VARAAKIHPAESAGTAPAFDLATDPGGAEVSLTIDASAAVALHFEDECEPFADMEARLAAREEAFTAPNFYQEVMEALRRAIREGRTTDSQVNAWLGVLDSYNIITVPVNPVAGCATWLLAETLNVSAYDAGYVSVAKAKGLPLWTRDVPLTKKLRRESIPFEPS